MPVSTIRSPDVLPAAGSQQLAGARPSNGPAKLFGNDGFTFKDLLDIVNPLQQLPVVGAVYRKLTGTDISAFSRMIGGALMGGPIGAVTALIGSGIEKVLMPGAPGDAGSESATELAEADTTAASANWGPTAYEERRGGWIVSAALGPLPPALYLEQPAAPGFDALAGPDSPQAPTALNLAGGSAEPRRGGWMVEAAYAQQDLLLTRESQHAGLHATA